MIKNILLDFIERENQKELTLKRMIIITFVTGVCSGIIWLLLFTFLINDEYLEKQKNLSNTIENLSELNDSEFSNLISDAINERSMYYKYKDNIINELNDRISHK